MQQLLVPILTFVSVLSIGGAIVVAQSARRQRLRMRLAEFGDVTAAALPGSGPPSTLAKALEQIGRSVTPSQSLDALNRRLTHAGMFGPGAAMIYVGVRMAVLIAGLVIAAAIVMPMDMILPVKAMIVIGAAWTVSLLPSLYVDVRRKARTTEIQHHLPEAVDLLEICVTAGMGLDMAWNAVSDEIRRVSPILADEMALANLEMHLGADRAVAMRHMAERTNSGDINALVGTLVQSERFGTPISDALRVFAESMRDLRQSRAAEAAEKLGIKMLFPMIVFILPAIIIVMAGSAVIRIIALFSSM